MHPDQIFQDDRPDEVRRTASCVAAVVGTDEVILPLLKVVGGAVPHLRPAVGAVDHAGKQAALARFRPAMALPTDFLHLVKHFLPDDRRMGIIENRPLVRRRFPLFPVPDGVGVGLEVDRAACVLPPFQYMDNGVGIPMTGITGFRAWGLDANLPLVRGGIQHPFLPQEPCDLHRSPPFHAQLEDSLHHHSRRFVHDPSGLILRVFAIPERNMDRQRNASLALCFVHRPDFAAGILGEKLVEPVLDAGDVAVRAVGVDGVKVVVDGDIPHIVLRESEVDVQPGQRGIPPQPGQILGDADGHPSRFDLREHGLKTGAVVVGAAVPVVHKKGRVGKAVLPGVLEQDHLLKRDLSRVFYPMFFLSNTK